MKNFKKKHLAFITILVLLWPYLSFPAVNQASQSLEPETSSEFSFEYYCELGEAFAVNPEELIKGAALGDWDTLSSRGMILPAQLMVAIYCAEMKRLGIEPDHETIEKILEENKIHVILIEPVKKMCPPCLDSAVIELDDGTELSALDIYCDKYAQPDENWLENKTYWHRSLMEFPDPFSEILSGKLVVSRDKEKKEYDFKMSLPEKPEDQISSIKPATEMLGEIWKRIKIRYPFNISNLKEIKITPYKRHEIFIERHNIYINEKTLYSLGYNESSIASLLLDTINYLKSEKDINAMIKTQQSLELTTILLGCVVTAGGICYLLDQVDYNSTGEESELVIMLGLIGGYIISFPFRYSLGKIKDFLEIDLNQTTISKLIEMEYDPWGFVFAIDHLNRYRNKTDMYAQISWDFSATIEVEVDLIKILITEEISNYSYWEKMKNDQWYLANDMARLIILKMEDEEFCPQKSQTWKIINSQEFEGDVSSADPQDVPYIIVKHYEMLRWMNNERWRNKMEKAKVKQEREEINLLILSLIKSTTGFITPTVGA